MERDADWWLDGERRWQQGVPPEGWERDPDGSWHPPIEPTLDDTEPIQRITVDTPALHRARSRAGPEPPRRRRVGPERATGLPEWLTFGAATLGAGVLLGGALLVTILTGRDESSPPDRGDPSSALPASSTSTTAAETRPAGSPSREATTPRSSEPTVTSTTTTVVTSTTMSLPPADALTLCGPGQRNLIERANHPWSWYVERFDPDGDGIFCE